MTQDLGDAFGTGSSPSVEPQGRLDASHSIPIASAMVERVSSAIEKEFFKIEELGTGRGIVTPDRIARCAIAAMREPTEAMLAAACADEATHAVNSLITIASVHGCALPSKYTGDNTALLRWWRAMIDAALARGDDR